MTKYIIKGRMSLDEIRKIGEERKNLHSDLLKKRNEELAKSKGFNNFSEYRKVRNEKWVRNKGFQNYADYMDDLAIKNGFENYNDYKKFQNYQNHISLPMNINKNCPLWLGVYIAENLLPDIFENVERMKFGNEGYDFICKNGYKIDVKMSCLHNDNRWLFSINYNQYAHYFLLIGIDNRIDLNILHIWLIKSNEVVSIRKGINYKIYNFKNFFISNNIGKINIYRKYELLDNKLNKAIEVCDKFKNKGENK